MKSIICILALALILVAAPALALVGPGQPLPDLTLPDADGRPHKLAELVQDKVALVVYWSLSCPHCRQEIPLILAQTKKLQGNPFVLLFVNTDGKAMAPAVKAYAQREGMPGPILMDLGPDDTLPLADAYDIIATPGVLVLDPTGKLVLAQELKPDLGQVMQAVRDSF